MNTHNHHRVIKEFANRARHESRIKDCIISKTEVNTLIKASDYTDHFPGLNNNGIPVAGLVQSGLEFKAKDEDPFFYYHFYYEITCKNNTIVLTRCSQTDTNSYKNPKNVQVDDNSKFKQSITVKTFDDMGRSYYDTYIETDFKKLFASINGREEYLRNNDDIDYSNQSDCVAFLHAMGASGDTSPEEAFKYHLKNCFAEYLFIKNKNEALFILGIAFHSIMDSFTPSHMNFQKYTEQDMAKHAQGDVIPFRTRDYTQNSMHTFGNSDLDYTIDDKDIDKYHLKSYKDYITDATYSEDIDSVYFDPGQYRDDAKASQGKTIFAALKKGYNDNDHINDTEFEMLKVFFNIGDLEQDPDIKSIKEGICDLSRSSFIYQGRDTIKEIVEPRSRQKLNDILKQKKFGDDAFVYSESAITAIKLIYAILLMGRQKCLNSFDSYKRSKNFYVDTAYNCWKSIYDSINSQREKHLNPNPYKK